MKIYAFSGLGTDGRIFKKLDLNHELIAVKWIEPNPGETLASYSIRLSEQIDTSSEYALLGVSFGGMLVSELTRTLDSKKVILISSATNKTELPLMASVSRRLKLHEILPRWIYRPPIWVTYLAFPFNPDQRKIAQEIVRDMDTEFIKWALGAIVNWDKEEPPPEVLHIHGKCDPIIPLKQRMNAEVIGRGHFIILRKAQEISARINSTLNE